MIRTHPTEFKLFYELLMANAPDQFVPHLFPLVIGGKKPLSSQTWGEPANRLSFDTAMKYISMGHNVGIASLTDSPLVIVDIDDIDDIPDTDVKYTLSVTTRTRTGRHYFYWATDDRCSINVPSPSGEIRSNNQYVLTAGSYVNTPLCDVPKEEIGYAGRYTVRNSVFPSRITYDEFPKKFLEHIDKMKKKTTIPPPRREPSGHKSKSKLFDLTISDVITYPKNKVRFPSPFHSSRTQANTGVSNGLLHCFAHSVTHNAIQALAVLSGLYTCQQAGKAHHNGMHGPSMVDMRDGYTSYSIWWHARHNAMIPRDDVPPRTALTWFAVETGICESSDIIDNMLPDWAYIETMQLLRSNV